MGGIKGASPFYREENRDPREAASHSEEASQRPRPNKLTTTPAGDKERRMAAGEPVFPVSSGMACPSRALLSVGVCGCRSPMQSDNFIVSKSSATNIF